MADDREHVGYGADPDPLPGSPGAASKEFDRVFDAAWTDGGGDDDGNYPVEQSRSGDAMRSSFPWGSSEASDEQEEGAAAQYHDTSRSRSTALPDASSRPRDEWYARHGFGDDHHEAWKKAGVEPQAAVSHLAAIDRAYNRDPAGTEAWLRAQRGVQLSQQEQQAAAKVDYEMRVDHLNRTVVADVRKTMPAKIWDRIEPFVANIAREIGQGKPELYGDPRQLSVVLPLIGTGLSPMLRGHEMW